MITVTETKVKLVVVGIAAIAFGSLLLKIALTPDETEEQTQQRLLLEAKKLITK